MDKFVKNVLTQNKWHTIIYVKIWKKEEPMNNLELGRAGEEAAAKILESGGYKILDRNYRCTSGEIDIVAERDLEISFIEVKTRRNYRYGRPCEAVNQIKKKHIRNAAISYLKEKNNGRIFYRKINFDIMEIVVEHMKTVF